MTIDTDIGYVQRKLEGTQAHIGSLAIQYKQLSHTIGCLQKDERELFGELLKLEKLPDWDRVETWGDVLGCTFRWFDFIRDDHEQRIYTEDEDYEVVILADDSVYGCNDLIPIPDSEVVFLGNYVR